MTRQYSFINEASFLHVLKHKLDPSAYQNYRMKLLLRIVNEKNPIKKEKLCKLLSKDNYYFYMI